ncbi:MAG: T9SS type A sorting domain-containing protein, partial [candidate division Zixibacteria bacterium]|nr:T9SS type A sorting domain-containing protein [candidate division Zixibacteria bacterium]
IASVVGEYIDFVAGSALDCDDQPVPIRFFSREVPPWPPCTDFDGNGNSNILDMVMLIDGMYLAGYINPEQAARVEALDGYEGVTSNDLMWMMGWMYHGSRLTCHTDFGNTFSVSSDTLKFSNLEVPADTTTWEVDVLVNALDPFHSLSVAFEYDFGDKDIELTNVEWLIETDLGMWDLHDAASKTAVFAAVNIVQEEVMYSYTPLARLTFTVGEVTTPRSITITPTTWHRNGSDHTTVLSRFHADTTFHGVMPVVTTFDRNPDKDSFGNYCFGVERGNVDMSFDGMVDIGDLTEVIEYLFVTFEEPTALGEADVAPLEAPDGAVDIGDITAFVDHLFINFCALPGCDLSGATKRTVDRVGDLGVTYENGQTVLSLRATQPLRGLQVELTTNEPDLHVTSPLEGQFDLLAGQQDNRVSVGLLDLDGPATLPISDKIVAVFDGHYDVVSARVSNLDHVTMSLGIVAGGLLPGEFGLAQNYPNPFNPTTDISLSIPAAGMVNLTVYNTLGQEVKALVNGEMAAGPHTVTWDGTNSAGEAVASGVYFYRLTAGDQTASKKMLLLK